MAKSGSVRIRVIDAAGLVIHDAEAYLPKRNKRPDLIKANKAGEIVFTGLPIGDSRIIVGHDGYKSLPLIVTIKNAQELKIDATLEADDHDHQLPGNFRNKPKW